MPLALKRGVGGTRASGSEIPDDADCRYGREVEEIQNARREGLAHGNAKMYVSDLVRDCEEIAGMFDEGLASPRSTDMAVSILYLLTQFD